MAATMIHADSAPSPCPRVRPWRRCGLGVLLWLAGALVAAGDDPDWLLIDTGAETLTLMRGEAPHVRFYGVAIGRYGTSSEKLRGDNTTPLGRFRIDRVKRDSAFHRFVGLSYPDAGRARRAHAQGQIDDRELAAILDAHRRGRTPPQDTALGGHIGIHGLGSADARLHEMSNWTRGCVALTDAQIDALLQWVRKGMAVEIR
jgi:murein L,D-transpeptidase YafK